MTSFVFSSFPLCSYSKKLSLINGKESMLCFQILFFFFNFFPFYNLFWPIC